MQVTPWLTVCKIALKTIDVRSVKYPGAACSNTRPGPFDGIRNGPVSEIFGGLFRSVAAVVSQTGQLNITNAAAFSSRQIVPRRVFCALSLACQQRNDSLSRGYR